MDITMCKGDNCKEKNTCLRYTTTPGILQSYFTDSPNKGYKCEFYIKINKKD